MGKIIVRGADELAKRLEDKEALRRRIEGIVRRASANTVNRISKHFIAGRAGFSATKLHNRSGNAGLAATIEFKLKKRGDVVSASVGTVKRNKSLRYAAIQEFGGIIKGRNKTIPIGGRKTASGTFLSIPFADNLTSGKRVRFGSFAELSQSPQWSPFTVKTKSGKIVTFATKFGVFDNNELSAFFIWVKKVKIPARPFVSPEQPEFLSEVKKFLSVAIRNQVNG